MKLVSINIEEDKHLDQVLPFLSHESPDVICIQEVFEHDLSRFTQLGYHVHFSPMCNKLMHNHAYASFGIALLSRNPFDTIAEHAYHRPTENIINHDRSRFLETVRGAVIVGEITHNGIVYRIGTTHFTWTPDADHPIPDQTLHQQALLRILAAAGPHCLCGDMNIPRGQTSLYQRFLTHYTNAIPESYTSSLDPSLHKLGQDPSKSKLFTSYMVDHLFIQPPYSAHDTQLVFGVSDHAAIVSHITIV